MKTFDGELLISCQTTTHIEIFCEISLCSEVIFKKMREADDILKEYLGVPKD